MGVKGCWDAYDFIFSTEKNKMIVLEKLSSFKPCTKTKTNDLLVSKSQIIEYFKEKTFFESELNEVFELVNNRSLTNSTIAIDLMKAFSSDTYYSKIKIVLENNECVYLDPESLERLSDAQIKFAKKNKINLMKTLESLNGTY
jgi:hypothetical protein